MRFLASYTLSPLKIRVLSVFNPQPVTWTRVLPGVIYRADTHFSSHVKAKGSFLALDASLEQCGDQPASFLDRLAIDWPPDDALLLHLVALIEQGDSPVQAAATGLLKRYLLTRGAALPASALERLFDLLPTLDQWESQLHVLQVLPVLPISARQAEKLRRFLEECLREPNKFVRAWAYGGWHRLASLQPKYRARTIDLLERAGREEAPSVRARLRRLPPL